MRVQLPFFNGLTPPRAITMINSNQEPLLADAAGEAARATTAPAAAQVDIRAITPAPEALENPSYAMRFQGAIHGLILYFPISLLIFVFFGGMTSGVIGNKKVTASDFKTGFIMFSVVEFMGGCLGFSSPTEFRNSLYSYFCCRKPQENIDQATVTATPPTETEETAPQLEDTNSSHTGSNISLSTIIADTAEEADEADEAGEDNGLRM